MGILARVKRSLNRVPRLYRRTADLHVLPSDATVVERRQNYAEMTCESWVRFIIVVVLGAAIIGVAWSAFTGSAVPFFAVAVVALVTVAQCRQYMTEVTVVPGDVPQTQVITSKRFAFFRKAPLVKSVEVHVGLKQQVRLYRRQPRTKLWFPLCWIPRMTQYYALVLPAPVRSSGSVSPPHRSDDPGGAHAGHSGVSAPSDVVEQVDEVAPRPSTSAGGVVSGVKALLTTIGNQRIRLGRKTAGGRNEGHRQLPATDGAPQENDVEHGQDCEDDDDSVSSASFESDFADTVDVSHVIGGDENRRDRDFANNDSDLWHHSINSNDDDGVNDGEQQLIVVRQDSVGELLFLGTEGLWDWLFRCRQKSRDRTEWFKLICFSCYDMPLPPVPAITRGMQRDWRRYEWENRCVIKVAPPDMLQLLIGAAKLVPLHTRTVGTLVEVFLTTREDSRFHHALVLFVYSTERGVTTAEMMARGQDMRAVLAIGDLAHSLDLDPSTAAAAAAAPAAVEAATNATGQSRQASQLVPEFGSEAMPLSPMSGGGASREPSFVTSSGSTLVAVPALPRVPSATYVEHTIEVPPLTKQVSAPLRK